MKRTRLVCFSDPASAANRLYKTLHVIRQVLDATLGPGASEETFRYEDGFLSLLPSVRVDVLEFEHVCTPRSILPTRLPRDYINFPLAQSP